MTITFRISMSNVEHCTFYRAHEVVLKRSFVISKDMFQWYQCMLILWASLGRIKITEILRYESTVGVSVVIGVTMERGGLDGFVDSCESGPVAVGLVLIYSSVDDISIDTAALVRLITCENVRILEVKGCEIRSWQ
jgi:hypothetical protein